MATITSTYKDPSKNFVWWIEGDKIAIATSEGDGGTTETGNGRLKAPIIGSGSDVITPFTDEEGESKEFNVRYGDFISAIENLSCNCYPLERFN